MSASEKLRQLRFESTVDDAELEVMGHGSLLILRDALPQIRALVEAAERVVILTYDPQKTDAENDELQRRTKTFNEALAALDEALS